MLDPHSDNPTWEQALLTSFLNLVQAPDGDLGAVGQLLQATSDRASFAAMIERLSQDPQGKYALDTQLTLGTVDLDQLHTLPEHTLGRLYAEHMRHNQLQPLPFATNGNVVDYLVTHMAATHDIWHVVTGNGTDILGEIRLEAFGVAQIAESRFWLALLAKNLLKAAIYDIERSTAYMEALTTGWLMGKQAQPLFGQDWQAMWSMPIAEVRAKLGVELPAQTPAAIEARASISA